MLGLALALAAPGALTAQASSGVGDDAVPVPAHGAVIRIGGLWTSSDARFAPTANGSKLGPLFGGYARDNLGTADIPRLAPTESAIRSLSGLGNAFTLSLGRLEAHGDVSRSVVPLQIDFGVTRRLSVGMLVPYVETRSNNRFVLNRGGTGATVGENPALSDTGAARATNGAVLEQIDLWRTALTAEIARCNDVTATGGGCDRIRLDPAAAQGTVADAELTRNQVSTLYGTAAAAGARLVPVQKSPAQVAVESRIRALQSSFSAYGVPTSTATALPVGATLIYGSAGLQALVQDTSLSLAYDTLARGGRAGIGDIDLVATWLLFDSFGASQSRRLSATTRALRSALGVGMRLGTATGGRSESPFDLPTGDGANALLARSTTDVILGRRFWVSGTVRYTHPLADNVVSRFPVVGDSTLFLPAVALQARRALGSRMEFELAPRVSIGQFFGFSMAYDYGRQAASTLTAAAAADNGGSYTATATSMGALQFGATFSTLASFMRGASRWPIEVVFSHGVTLTGSGGVVPNTTSDRVEMRIYTRFPRR